MVSLDEEKTKKDKRDVKTKFCYAYIRARRHRVDSNSNFPF